VKVTTPKIPIPPPQRNKKKKKRKKEKKRLLFYDWYQVPTRKED